MKIIAMITALLLTSGVAQAAETLSVSPYPATALWKKITDRHDGQLTWIEWIPADQAVDDIHDILTEQILPTQKGTRAADFMTGFFKRIYAACTGLSVNGPNNRTEDGYDVAYGQAYCVGQKGAGKDVDIFLKVISGHDALYVVQREFRRPAVPGAVAGKRGFSGPDAKQEAEASLAAQQVANDFLVSQVKLCTDNTCVPAAAPTAQPSAASAPVDKNDVSSSFGFEPGKTTANEVSDKLGRPSRQTKVPDGRHSYMYIGLKGLIVNFLFGKDDILIRTIAFSDPGR